jgi:hypothetical protein
MQNTRVLAVRVFGICDPKETLSDQVIILNYIMTHCNFLYDHIGIFFGIIYIIGLPGNCPHAGESDPIWTAR